MECLFISISPRFGELERALSFFTLKYYLGFVCGPPDTKVLTYYLGVPKLRVQWPKFATCLHAPWFFFLLSRGKLHAGCFHEGGLRGKPATSKAMTLKQQLWDSKACKTCLVCFLMSLPWCCSTSPSFSTPDPKQWERGWDLTIHENHPWKMAIWQPWNCGGLFT